MITIPVGLSRKMTPSPPWPGTRSCLIVVWVSIWLILAVDFVKEERKDCVKDKYRGEYESI